MVYKVPPINKGVASLFVTREILKNQTFLAARKICSYYGDLNLILWCYIHANFKFYSGLQKNKHIGIKCILEKSEGGSIGLLIYWLGFSLTGDGFSLFYWCRFSLFYWCLIFAYVRLLSSPSNVLKCGHIITFATAFAVTPLTTMDQ